MPPTPDSSPQASAATPRQTSGTPARAALLRKRGVVNVIGLDAEVGGDVVTDHFQPLELTYGGWNEAAFISAELKERVSMVRVLVLSVSLITLLYLLVNWA